MQVLSKLRKLRIKLDGMIQNLAKYFDEDNDIFVIKAKRKIVKNLLIKFSSTLDQVAEAVGGSINFVKTVKEKLLVEN